MTRIERTDQRDALLHLGGSLGPGGTSAYIEEMEAAGQRQVVNSTRIPTEISNGSEDDLRALGFELGDVDADDRLFRHAHLPAGWARRGTDHSLWTEIVDDADEIRAMIFYKAAYYDRRAFLSIRSGGTS